MSILMSAGGAPTARIPSRRRMWIGAMKRPCRTPELKPGYTPPKAPPLAEEIVIAQQVHSQAQSLVGSFMNNVKIGGAIDVAPPIHQLADELQNSVLRNANALSCLGGRIREKDNYLLEHSVNLSVLMSLFGHYRKLSQDVLHQTIVGALLHDIGKILTPDEVLHKPGRLTAEEFEVMKLHARHSRDILASTEGIGGEITVITAAQHHEKLDGSGYPEGLKGDEITEYGRMVAITDVYDAITADRVYHKGLTRLKAEETAGVVRGGSPGSDAGETVYTLRWAVPDRFIGLA